MYVASIEEHGVEGDEIQAANEGRLVGAVFPPKRFSKLRMQPPMVDVGYRFTWTDEFETVERSQTVLPPTRTTTHGALLARVKDAVISVSTGKSLLAILFSGDLLAIGRCRANYQTHSAGCEAANAIDSSECREMVLLSSVTGARHFQAACFVIPMAWSERVSWGCSRNLGAGSTITCRGLLGAFVNGKR